MEDGEQGEEVETGGLPVFEAVPGRGKHKGAKSGRHRSQNRGVSADAGDGGRSTSVPPAGRRFQVFDAVPGRDRGGARSGRHRSLEPVGGQGVPTFPVYPAVPGSGNKRDSGRDKRAEGGEKQFQVFEAVPGGERRSARVERQDGHQKQFEAGASDANVQEETEEIQQKEFEVFEAVPGGDENTRMTREEPEHKEFQVFEAVPQRDREREDPEGEEDDREREDDHQARFQVFEAVPGKIAGELQVETG